MATGAWGWSAHGAGGGVGAGVAGRAHGAGARPVGQGIGNDARCGVWPGRYWDVGGAVGWGATAAAAGPGTRAEASKAQGSPRGVSLHPARAGWPLRPMQAATTRPLGP